MTRLTRRDLMALGGAGLTTALWPQRLAANAVEAASAVDPESLLHFVDPELRGPFLSRQTVVNAATLPQVRAGLTGRSPPPPAGPAIVRRAIPGPKGAPDVMVSLINAGTRNSPRRPALLYLHGGGYVAGSATGELAMAQQIARDHDCVVLSVDYRLAPETRYPGALEDNYAALK